MNEEELFKMTDLHNVSVRLAGVLLIQDGEITLSDIESLPFVETREEALSIARKLVHVFGEEYRVEMHDDHLSNMHLTLAGTKKGQGVHA